MLSATRRADSEFRCSGLHRGTIGAGLIVLIDTFNGGLMISLRRSEERGHVDHGWLNTYHSFSFDTYRDENHMGFRSLRVINDDTVQPGLGFGMHPHRDMEIITYVLEGALEHKDSMGNGSVIRPGDVQRMSAGRGVLHSEFNHSRDEPVHLLQIWILPAEKGINPSYEERTFSRDQKLGRLCLIASPGGADGSVSINQDARLFASILTKEHEISVPLQSGRHLWVHLARGSGRVNDYALTGGDAAAVSEESEIVLAGNDEAEFLVFDLK
jgi:redox-sensitive bicupin YhaK (pirin superfamily)